MKPLAARLIVFLLLGGLVGVASLIKGLSESRFIYTSLGVLILAGVLLFLLGWVRESRKR